MRQMDFKIVLGSALLACLVAAGRLEASFHAWNIAEIYSNADGKVQFVELTCPESGENSLAGQRLYCKQGSRTNVFVFPSNVTGETLNKRLLLATANFAAQPGAVAPNYTLPNNFLFFTNGKVNFANVDNLAYTNLPTDGRRSLVRSANTFVLATNSPQNFAGHAGSIVPVRILRGVRSGTNILISFATATGKTYTVEFKAAPTTPPAWQTLATVSGNGKTRTVTNSLGAARRFYRLRAN
jgi:hypothetical protein